MKKQKGFTAVELIAAVLILVCAAGWGLNIYKLATFGGQFIEMGIMEVLRVIGIFVVPLGALLGFL